MSKPANLNIKYEYKPLTFNIKDSHVYIPIEQKLHVTKILSTLNSTEKMIKQQILQALHTILNQNYFQFKDSFYKPPTSVTMGSPISAHIAKIFVQYYETLSIKPANENKHILFYTRYFDDILTIYGHTKIIFEQILPYANSLNTNLQFPPKHEINTTINILSLLIRGNTKGLDNDVYRKHTCTDTTIYFFQPPCVTESSSLQIPYTYYHLTLKKHTLSMEHHSIHRQDRRIFLNSNLQTQYKNNSKIIFTTFTK